MQNIIQYFFFLVQPPPVANFPRGKSMKKVLLNSERSQLRTSKSSGVHPINFNYIYHRRLNIYFPPSLSPVQIVFPVAYLKSLISGSSTSIVSPPLSAKPSKNIPSFPCPPSFPRARSRTRCQPKEEWIITAGKEKREINADNIEPTNRKKPIYFF